MKSKATILGIAAAAVLVLGGLYYVLVMKGGTLAVDLPKSIEIDQSQIVAQPAVETGSVLGESEPYENPLTEIYVNPFSK